MNKTSADPKLELIIKNISETSKAIRRGGELSADVIDAFCDDVAALAEEKAEAVSGLSEKDLYSPKGEAMEEEAAVLEDAVDLLSEASVFCSECIENNSKEDREELSYLLADAADLLRDLL